MFTVPFDPAEHEVFETDVVRAFRRETGYQSLVGVHNKGAGTNVLAFRSDCGAFIGEFDFLDGEAGTGLVPSPAGFQRIVRRLKTSGDPAKVKEGIEKNFREQRRAFVESEEMRLAAIDSMARTVQRERGEGAATEYLRGAGILKPTTIFSGASGRERTD